jgi:uroporphyrinogen decarboxylase
MTCGSSYQTRVLEARKDPDFERFKTMLQRKTPDRAVLYEFYIHPPTADVLLGRPFPDYAERSTSYQLGIAEAYLHGGYDYAPLIPPTFGFRLPHREQARGSTVSMNDGAMIGTMEDLSRLTWPNGRDCNPAVLAEVGDALPGGMKYVACAPSGVLENSMRMLGFENFCMLAADGDPLVQAVVDHVGQSILSFYEFCLQSEAVGAIMVNDDWGYRSGPMLSPDMLRSLIMPWHHRFVMAANARGCPALLHSCGNLEVVMDDIIDCLGYAAKHSYEDAILPVEKAWERWGSRIAILGGIDLDFVCRESPEAVYRRCREMVETTQCKGYALGTGNQIARYAPVEQSFAMLAAAIDTWE